MHTTSQSKLEFHTVDGGCCVGAELVPRTIAQAASLSALPESSCNRNDEPVRTYPLMRLRKLTQ